MPYRGRVDSPQSLGLMLQQGRLLAGKSQRDLADELGISQRYISELETGKTSIAVERLFAAMRATGVQLTAEITPIGAAFASADDDDDDDDLERQAHG